MIEKSKKTSQASDKKVEPAKPSAATTLKSGLSSAKESNKPSSAAGTTPTAKPAGSAAPPSAPNAGATAPAAAPRPGDDIKSSSELQEKRNRVHPPQIGMVDQLRDAFGGGDSSAQSPSRAWTSKIGDILTGNSGRLRNLAGLARPAESDSAQDPHGAAPKEEPQKPANLWEKLWGIPAPQPKEPLLKETPAAEVPAQRAGAKDPQSLQGDYRSPSDTQVQHNWGEESLPRSLSQEQRPAVEQAAAQKPANEQDTAAKQNSVLKPLVEQDKAPKPAVESSNAPKPAVEQGDQKPGAEVSSAHKPAAEQAQKAVEPTSAPKPGPEQAATQKSTTEQASIQKPVAEQESAQKPASAQTTAFKPLVEQAAAQKPATEQTSAQKPDAEQNSAQKPALESSGATKPAVQPAEAQKPAVGQVTGQKPVVEQSGAQKSAPEQANAQKLAAETKPEANKDEARLAQEKEAQRLQVEQAARQASTPASQSTVAQPAVQNSSLDAVAAAKAGSRPEANKAGKELKGSIEKDPLKDKKDALGKTGATDKKDREQAIDRATRNLSGEEKARVESLLRHSKIDNDLLKEITKDGFSIEVVDNKDQILRDNKGNLHEGVFNYNDNKIRLSESAFRDPKELDKVLSDELGHRIDDRLRENPETSQKWSSLMKEYAAKERKDSQINSNAASNQGEFGSEVISSYLRGGKDEQKLKESYPELYKIVKDTVGKSDSSDLETRPQGMAGRFAQAVAAQQNQLTGNYFTANLQPTAGDRNTTSERSVNPVQESKKPAASGTQVASLRGDGESGANAKPVTAKATTDSGGGASSSAPVQLASFSSQTNTTSQPASTSKASAPATQNDGPSSANPAVHAVRDTPTQTPATQTEPQGPAQQQPAVQQPPAQQPPAQQPAAQQPPAQQPPAQQPAAQQPAAQQTPPKEPAAQQQPAQQPPAQQPAAQQTPPREPSPQPAQQQPPAQQSPAPRESTFQPAQPQQTSSSSNYYNQSSYSNSSNYYNTSNYYNQSSNSFFNNSNLSSYMDQSLFNQFEQSGLSNMLQDHAFQSLGMAQQDLMALDQSLAQAGGLQELQKLSQGLQGLDGLPEQLKGLEGLKDLAPMLQNVPETLEGLGKVQNLVDRAQNLPGNPKDFARNPDVRSLLQELPGATRQVAGLGGLAQGGSALSGQLAQLNQVRQVGDNLQQLGRQSQEWKDLPAKLDQVSLALPVVRAAQQEGSLPTAVDHQFGQLRGSDQGRRDERPQSAINPAGRAQVQGENLSGLKTPTGQPVGSEGPVVRPQPVEPHGPGQQPARAVQAPAVGQQLPSPANQQPAARAPQPGQQPVGQQPAAPIGQQPAAPAPQAPAVGQPAATVGPQTQPVGQQPAVPAGPQSPGRAPQAPVVGQPAATVAPQAQPVGPQPATPVGQQSAVRAPQAQSVAQPAATVGPQAQTAGQPAAGPQSSIRASQAPAGVQPTASAGVQPPSRPGQTPVVGQSQAQPVRTQQVQPASTRAATPAIAKLDGKMTQRLQTAPMVARQLEKLPQAQQNLKTVVQGLEKTAQQPKGLEALQRTAEDPGSLHRGLQRLEQLVDSPQDKANVQSLRKTLDPVLTNSKMTDGLKQAGQALKPLGETAGRQQVLSLKRVQLDTPATRKVAQQLRQPAAKAPTQRVSEGISQARELERATEAQNNRLPHLSQEMTQDLGESLAKIISDAQAANRPRSLFGIQLGGAGTRPATGTAPAGAVPAGGAPAGPARPAAPARPTQPVAQPAAAATAASAPQARPAAAPVKPGPAPKATVGQPKETMSKARIDAYRQSYETVREQMIGKSGKDHAWALVYHSRDAEGAKGLTDTLESNVVKGGSGKMQSWLNDMTKTPDSAVALSAILANVANVAPDRMMGIMLLTTDGAGGKETVGDAFHKMSQNVDSSLRLSHFLEKSSEHPAAARGLAELLEGQTEPSGESWKSANRTAETFRGISETVGGARRLTQTLENLGEVEGGNRLVARTINRMTREPEGALNTLETLQNLAHDREGAGQLGRVLSRASESRDGARDLLTSFQSMSKSTGGKQDVARLFVRLAEGGQGSRLLANFVKDGNNSHQLAGVFEQLNQNPESRALLAHALDQMAKNPRQRSSYEVFAGRVAASETLQAVVQETTGENERAEGGEAAYPELTKLRPLPVRSLDNPTETADLVLHKPADLQRVSDSWRAERPSAAESQAPASASAVAQTERPAEAPADARNFRPGDVYSEETLRQARICGDCGGRTTSMGLCPRCATRKRSSQAQAV